MWQAETFDEATIDRELGWAQGLGFNSVRVFLHNFPWEQDEPGFLVRKGNAMPRPITPALAADAIIELIDRPGRPIVLIERAFPPQGWAIPGGFVDVGETMEQAASREAQEETGLEVRLIALLGIYSGPNRDPRGHTVTAVYVAQATGEPTAADDAKHCSVVMPDELPQPLVFDHALVLEDYRQFRATGRVAPLR